MASKTDLIAREPILRQRFLQELEILEEFRMAYLARNPDVPLSSGDQDIQRLIEAQALFSARTAHIAEQTMTRSMERLFAQHFPYLTAPSPACTLLEARLDGRFVDSSYIPEGERITISVENGQDVIFRTTSGIPLLPVCLSDLQITHAFDDVEALTLRFESAHPRRGPIGRLPIYVRHFNELEASAYLFYQLESSIRRAEVYFDQHDELINRQLCKLEFGVPSALTKSGHIIDHPLATARTFFRLPEQGLFMTAYIPEPTVEWSSFTLVLYLNSPWDRKLHLSPENLRLHIIPVTNLFSDMSSPLTFDGFQTSASIVHEERSDAQLHSIQGVYRVDADQGLVPIFPGFVPRHNKARNEWAWELSQYITRSGRRSELRVSSSTAIENPTRVSVEGFWHQPSTSTQVSENAAAHLLDRYLEGVNFAVIGPTVGSKAPFAEENQDLLLELLNTRSRRFLNLSDLKGLIKVLLGPGDSVFTRLVSSMSSLTTQAIPSPKLMAGVRYDYILEMSELDTRDIPLVHLMIRGLQKVLKAWSTEEVLTLHIRLPDLDQTIIYPSPRAPLQL